MEKIQPIERQAVKISDFEIEITKPAIIIAPKKNVYDRTFIENQIVQIQKQKDEFDAIRDAEIAECEEILVDMDKLDIVNKLEAIKLEDVIPIEKLSDKIV